MIIISCENWNRVKFCISLEIYFGINENKFTYIVRDYLSYYIFLVLRRSVILVNNIIIDDNQITKSQISDYLQFDKYFYRGYENSFIQLLSNFSNKDLFVGNNGFSFFDNAVKVLKFDNVVFLENINISGRTFIDIQGSNSKSYFLNNIKKYESLWNMKNISNYDMEKNKINLNLSYFESIILNKYLMFLASRILLPIDKIFNSTRIKEGNLLKKILKNFYKKKLKHKYNLNTNDSLVILQVSNDSQLNYNTEIINPMEYLINKAKVGTSGSVFIKTHPKEYPHSLINKYKDTSMIFTEDWPLKVSRKSNVYIFNSSTIINMPDNCSKSTIFNIEKSIHFYLYNNQHHYQDFLNSCTIKLPFN
jgi:hypothetical protein